MTFNDLDEYTIKRELARVMNCHSVDNLLGAPDYILAEILFRELHILHNRQLVAKYECSGVLDGELKTAKNEP